LELLSSLWSHSPRWTPSRMTGWWRSAGAIAVAEYAARHGRPRWTAGTMDTRLTCRRSASPAAHHERRRWY